MTKLTDVDICHELNQKLGFVDLYLPSFRQLMITNLYLIYDECQFHRTQYCEDSERYINIWKGNFEQ